MYYSKVSDELDLEFLNESKLKQSNLAAKSKIEELRRQREELEAALESVRTMKAEASEWIGESANLKPSPITDLIYAYDDLSSQIIRLHADVLAHDDAMYFLSKSLSSRDNKNDDINTYIKETRKLARQQFLSKAQLLKIASNLSSSKVH